MTAAGCARGASDLTTVAEVVEQVGVVLARQQHLPAAEFGGLAGDAFRHHAASSAAVAARLAADVSLLASGLATLGHELGTAEDLRAEAAGSPADRALALRRRARRVEETAQDDWRAAMSRFADRGTPGGPASVDPQPVVPGSVIHPLGPDAEGHPGATGAPLAPGHRSAAPAAVRPGVAAGPPRHRVAGPATPGTGPAAPEPPLRAELVEPRRLESELVPPPGRCGTLPVDPADPVDPAHQGGGQ